MGNKEKIICPCCQDVLACKRCDTEIRSDQLLLICSVCNSELNTSLSTQKAAVWLLYRAYGMEQAEIAEKFNITQGRVSQICSELEKEFPLLRGLREAYSKAEAFNLLGKCDNPIRDSWQEKHERLTLKHDNIDHVHAQSSINLDRLTSVYLEQVDAILADKKKKEKYFRDQKRKTTVSRKGRQK